MAAVARAASGWSQEVLPGLPCRCQEPEHLRELGWKWGSQHFSGRCYRAPASLNAAPQYCPSPLVITPTVFRIKPFLRALSARGMEQGHVDVVLGLGGRSRLVSGLLEGQGQGRACLGAALCLGGELVMSWSVPDCAVLGRLAKWPCRGRRGLRHSS